MQNMLLLLKLCALLCVKPSWFVVIQSIIYITFIVMMQTVIIQEVHPNLPRAHIAVLAAAAAAAVFPCANIPPSGDLVLVCRYQG